MATFGVIVGIVVCVLAAFGAGVLVADKLISTFFIKW